MSRVVVVGAGIAGLVASLALARRGHAVVLVESDGAPAPARAEHMWAAWRRPGTPQARHLHGFPGRIRTLLRDRLPDVLAALLANGAGELAFRAPDGSHEPGDEDLVALLCRRPVFEGTLRHVVEAEAGVRVRAGGAVTGLLTDPAGGADVPAGVPAGVPRIRGVRLAGGEAVVGDVVVDASGRRTKVADWLAAVGAHRPAEESSPTGVVYYGRHFALRDGAAPRGPGTGGEAINVQGSLGYLNYRLLATDNRTFIVNFGAPTWDQELRALRHAGAFMAAAGSIPQLAPWLAPDCAAPIGGVEAMGALQNTWRAFIVDGTPVALGLHVIGDARCHTNPSHAKGISMALAHAFALADLLDTVPLDPWQQALALDRAVGDETRQVYEFSLAADAAGARAWRGEPPTPDQAHGFIRSVIGPAAAVDPVVFRAFQRHVHVLRPPGELLGDAEVVARARRALAARAPEASPSPPSGPDRRSLLALLSAARGST